MSGPRQPRSVGWVARLITLPIVAYQKVISPWFPQQCRFYPSCSNYAVQAIRERGALIGPVLAGYRVLRCNPWARGGVDVPPHRGQRWPSWDGVVAPSNLPGPDSSPPSGAEHNS
ncbi:membrane protein insertion efficiency factor YidD [Serinibacter salmoneus]|uniref:Putative membrane protein insertion efficiency factor n=1 Tax=Serinibacter salmoneus TaxID=556530 RepID=A0A2A9D5C0_9MICO|nr:membrane protein insertion efficiency factor YidD [Serinibacter salmoneus]PFG21152.1 putative membrane protein insertion efficiency factor [Serinibacter salmoneus]